MEISNTIILVKDYRVLYEQEFNFTEGVHIQRFILPF